VRREIDDVQLRSVDGTDCVTERLFVTIHKAGRRLETDTVAVTASDASGKAKSTVHLPRIGRPAEIETFGSNGDLDRDFMTGGFDGARCEGARR
jgi:hypothetical protein